MTVQRRVGLNTLFLLVNKAAYVVAWIGLTPPTLERLGPERFGFWSLLLVIGGALTFFDLGLTAAITRTTAQMAAVGTWGGLRRSVSHAALLYVAFATIVVGVGAAVTPWVLDAFNVPDAWRGDAAIAYRLALLCFGVSTVGSVLQAVLIGLQRLDWVAGIGLSLIAVLVALVVAALHQPAPLVSVVGAQLVHAILTCAVLGIVSWRLLRRPDTPGAGALATPSLRELVRYGLRVQVSVLATFLHSQLDKLMIGAWVGLAWVAPCDLGLRVVNGVGSVPQLLMLSLLPALADRDARQKGDRADLYHEMIEPYVLVVVPICVGTATLAGPLFQAWLGAPRPDAALALRLLMAAGGMTLLVGAPATMLRAAGRPGLEAAYSAGALVAHGVLGFVGLRLWGWTGAIWGGVAATWIASAWFVIAAERWIDVSGAKGLALVLAKTLVPAGLAALATSLAMRSLPLGEGRAGALVWLCGGAIGFAAIYVGLAFVLAPGPSRRFLRRLRAT